MMGYYIQCPEPHNKANQLVDALGAKVVSAEEAKDFVESDKAVVCVVDNGPFEAAAYCYDLREYKHFNLPEDNRPKVWLVIDDLERVRKLSGYNKSS